MIFLNIDSINFSTGSKLPESNSHEKKGSTYRKKLIHQTSITSEIDRHLHGSSTESLGPIGGMYYKKLIFLGNY